MDKIILGVDFKDNAEKLCAEAAKYAAKLKASIILVHAIEHIPYYPYFPHDERKVQGFYIRDLNHKLDQLESYIELYDIKVSGRVVEKGRTYEVLCKSADENNAAAILVGVGQHYLFEELIGSTTEKVCSLAKQKVVLINEPKSSQVKNILCAFDFSESSLTALSSAIRFAHFFKTSLRILHVHDTKENEVDISPHISVLAEKAIEAEFEKLNDRNSFTYDIILKKGIPIMEILKTVDDLDVDLLSIGASGHSKLTRLLLGSTVSKIIRKAPCSIVISPKNI